MRAVGVCARDADLGLGWLTPNSWEKDKEKEEYI
jgi:hypothetical protein